MMKTFNLWKARVMEEINNERYKRIVEKLINNVKLNQVDINFLRREGILY